MGWLVAGPRGLFSVGTYLNSYYVAALSPVAAAPCGTGIAACGPRPWTARVRLIVAATVLGCVGYGAYLMSGTASGPVELTLVALVVAVAATAQLLLPASGQGGHLTAVAFAGAAVLLLPAAASVSSVIRGLGPFDTPFESPETARHSQALAAAVPALTRAVQRAELWMPPADAGICTAGVPGGPGPAGAVDRVALHQAAPAPAPPSGPVRELPLRTRAGQPARSHSDRGTCTAGRSFWLTAALIAGGSRAPAWSSPRVCGAAPGSPGLLDRVPVSR